LYLSNNFRYQEMTYIRLDTSLRRTHIGRSLRFILASDFSPLPNVYIAVSHVGAVNAVVVRSAAGLSIAGRGSALAGCKRFVGR
jgi:hypothetical protein